MPKRSEESKWDRPESLKDLINRLPKWGILFAIGEWLFDWLYYLFDRSALVRGSVQTIFAVSLIGGIATFAFDIIDRQEDRVLRAWQVLASGAQVEGNVGQGQAIQFLVSRGQSFEKIRLPNAGLRKIDLTRASLAGADLSGADLSEAVLRRADLTGANLSDANLYKADLSGTVLEGATIGRANLQEADMTEANLQGAILIESNMQMADLTKADLRRSQLQISNMGGARLADANMEGVDLSSYVKKEGDDYPSNYDFGTNLENADLTRANLKDVFMSKTNLSGAKLNNAILQNSNLSNSRFVGADLSNADLRGTSLGYTNFENARLANVNFEGAEFEEGAGFRSASRWSGPNFKGADLSGAMLDVEGIKSDALVESCGSVSTKLPKDVNIPHC